MRSSASPVRARPGDPAPGGTAPFRLSDARPLLESLGFRPRKSLGQNFLHDPRSIDRIAAAAELTHADLAFEIGTGIGTLTQDLAARAGEVWSVEVDALLFDVARRLLRGLPNVHLIHGDILAGKHGIDPSILGSVPAPPRPGGSIVHVSNLPYSVAIPVILGLLERELRIRRMVVTVQREIADRILAQPGSGDYGIVTVLLHLQASAGVLFDLPPEVFWPRPEVHSRVLLIRRRDGGVDAEEYAGIRRLLKRMFARRRKTVLQAVLPGGRMTPGGRSSRDEVRVRILDAGIDPVRRPETLTPEEVMAISRALHPY